MKVTFGYDTVADDRIFRNVVDVEWDGGNEATIHQRWKGDVDEIPIRGFDTLTVEEEES